MAKFVNYRKRRFTLPAGCKDLIDMLEPARRRAAVPDAGAAACPRGIRQGHFHAAGLAQIGRYLSALLRSSAKLLIVRVRYREGRPPVVLFRSRGASAFVMALYADDAEEEEAIRAYFGGEGIPALEEIAASEAGGPGSPRAFAYPLPQEASGATSLATGLLRAVYGWSDAGGLDFYCFKVRTPA